MCQHIFLIYNESVTFITFARTLNVPRLCKWGTQPIQLQTSLSVPILLVHPLLSKNLLHFEVFHIALEPDQLFDFFKQNKALRTLIVPAPNFPLKEFHNLISSREKCINFNLLKREEHKDAFLRSRKRRILPIQEYMANVSNVNTALLSQKELKFQLR